MHLSLCLSEKVSSTIRNSFRFVLLIYSSSFCIDFVVLYFSPSFSSSFYGRREFDFLFWDNQLDKGIKLTHFLNVLPPTTTYMEYARFNLWSWLCFNKWLGRHTYVQSCTDLEYLRRRIKRIQTPRILTEGSQLTSSKKNRKFECVKNKKNDGGDVDVVGDAEQRFWKITNIIE